MVNGKARKRRSVRRFYLRNNISKKCDVWVLIHSNIRGYDSKALSLHAIADKADVVTINETSLKNNRILKMPGFTCYNRNRQGVNGGGIATCIKNKDAKDTLKVFEGKDDEEIVIPRHGQFDIPINVINMYGSQECRTSRDKIQEQWGNLLQEIAKIEAKEELFCIIGDLNRHVGDLIVGNEKDKVSFGGQLIRELLDTGKYCLVNASDKVVGGPFTRYDPSDPSNDDKKSVLELCIVSKELFKYVDSLTIDKERHFTLFRPISKNVLRFTDHYSLRLIFKNIPIKPSKPVGGRKVIRWNTKKDGGWETYTRLAENNAELLKIANDENDNPDKIVRKVDNVLKDIKYQAFGKVKEKGKQKNCKELETLMKEKSELLSDKIEKQQNVIDDKINDIDSKIAENLIKKQRAAFEQELESLRMLKNSKGMSAAVFNLREKVVGPKAAKQEATVVIDPKKNSEVTSPDEIKRVSLQYCVDLLTNRKPKEDFEDDLWWKQIVHNMRMEERFEDDIHEITDDMLQKTYDTLKKKPGTKYNFIMKGGMAVKAALFTLCKVIWKTEEFPCVWEKSTLVQLYKLKGPRSVLDNNRHIHIKEEYPKKIGHLVVSAAKDKMISNLTKFQIATKPGHRTQEHLFVIKSVMALYMSYVGFE